MNSIKNFINDEAGVTAIEYALMAAVVGAIVVAGGTILGKAVNDMFTKVAGLVK